MNMVQLSVKNSQILSPPKQIEMFSSVLINIRWCDSSCSSLEASLAVIMTPPNVIVSLLEYNNNMIRHIVGLQKHELVTLHPGDLAARNVSSLNRNEARVRRFMRIVL